MYYNISAYVCKVLLTEKVHYFCVLIVFLYLLLYSGLQLWFWCAKDVKKYKRKAQSFPNFRGGNRGGNRGGFDLRTVKVLVLSRPLYVYHIFQKVIAFFANKLYNIVLTYS